MACKVLIAFTLLLVNFGCTRATRVTPAAEELGAEEVVTSGDGRLRVFHNKSGVQTDSSALDVNDSHPQRRHNTSTQAHYDVPRLYGDSWQTHMNAVNALRRSATSMQDVNKHLSAQSDVDILRTTVQPAGGTARGSEALLQEATAAIGTHINSIIADSGRHPVFWYIWLLSAVNSVKPATWIVLGCLVLLLTFIFSSCIYIYQKGTTESSAREERRRLQSSKPRLKYLKDGHTLYEWNQTPSTITMYAKPPGNVSSKKIDVLVWPDSIYIGRKGKPPFLEETLSAEIDPHKSSWFITDDGELQVILKKVIEDQEWRSLIWRHREVRPRHTEPAARAIRTTKSDAHQARQSQPAGSKTESVARAARHTMAALGLKKPRNSSDDAEGCRSPRPIVRSPTWTKKH